MFVKRLSFLMMGTLLALAAMAQSEIAISTKPSADSFVLVSNNQNERQRC